MTSRAQRASAFNIDFDPDREQIVKLLCEDHVGTYVLPFQCVRRDGQWFNAQNGVRVEAAVIGWCEWTAPRFARPMQGARLRDAMQTAPADPGPPLSSV